MPTELATTPYFGIVHDRSLEAWRRTLDGPFLARIRDIAARRRCTVLLPIYLKPQMACSSTRSWWSALMAI